MIKESVFLFLLIGQEGAIERKYVGRLSNCNQSIPLYEKLLKTYKNVNGYLCLDEATARKAFQKKPTPNQQYIINELHELILPEPKGKPLFLKKRELDD